MVTSKAGDYTRSFDCKSLFSNCDLYLPNRVASGSCLRVNHDGLIAEISDETDCSSELFTDLLGQNVAPGLIDIRVHRGANRWVWESKSISDVSEIDSELLARGVTRWCPTIVSSRKEDVDTALNLSFESSKLGLGVVGVHLEGPWISSEQVGGNLPVDARPLSDRELYLVAGLAQAFPVVLTLAPELVPFDVLKFLAGSGVRLLAGHTRAGYDQFEAFFEAGGAGVLDIGCASGLLEAGEPFALGALMGRADKCALIGPLQSRVHPQALSVVKRALRGNQLIATGGTRRRSSPDLTGSLMIGRHDAEFDFGDLPSASWSCSLFSGLRFLVQRSGIPLDEAIRMCSTYPANFLRVSDSFGSISRGKFADFVSFSNYFVVSSVYRAGECFFPGRC